MNTPVGIYVSIPFCKAKCSFCNFASDVFGSERMDSYIDRLCREIVSARHEAQRTGAVLEASADSVYFGGGTPSLLSPDQFRRIFTALRGEFHISQEAEITVECAPGQLSSETLEALQREGMNRVSLGVQSFVDREARTVGRLHTGPECEAEIARLQAAGVSKTGLDLIVGLPHQTEASWRESVDRALESGVGHISVYMLEVDEDSRLGREALAGGVRYGAGDLPHEDDVAEWYEMGCELLQKAGTGQYEISNFARDGERSLHNMKYWRRLPYIGFGLDAHSMLLSENGSVRFQNPDGMNVYMNDPTGPFPMVGVEAQERPVERVSREAAFEESIFLGLRLNAGVRLTDLRESFGVEMVESLMPSMAEVCEAGLLTMDEERIRLTAKGRLASNEVFSRLLVAAAV
ncbi:radical SAM family heme chaperone HemW [Edaphobacter sp. HDX4]|uniref:radical SAM family heme chaperone HemW n=1 Tax=Edaphobacter sp. HDX4 TaxID=2794064 RepID=UPI002FE69BDB